MNDIFTRAGNETQRLKFSLIVNLQSSRRIVSSSNVDVSVHRVLLTAVLLVTASTRLPEFAGFRGRRYPGTCPPRRQPVEPWRPRLAQVLEVQEAPPPEDRVVRRRRGDLVYISPAVQILVTPAPPTPHTHIH